ncbi:MAG: TetR/AcrR family transcriptional regulator [Bacillus sp. (in: firmicutes)]
MNKRKKNVLLAAQQLFLEKGFQNTSIQEILDNAKISKGTFYNYFSSKNDCLIAILEIGREEADLIRREIQIGKEATDKTVFAEQIAILMKVNLKRNLMPIFEALHHSGEPELRKSIANYHFKEIQWLSKRLVDIYGQDLESYSYDCGVMLYGMLQHFRNILRATKHGPLDEVVIIDYVLARMDDLVPNIIQTKEKLLNDEIKHYLNENKQEQAISRDGVIEHIEIFVSQLDRQDHPKGRELVQFILKEFRSKTPNLYVVEALLNSVRQAYKETMHEDNAHKLTNIIWQYIEERN